MSKDEVQLSHVLVLYDNLRQDRLLIPALQSLSYQVSVAQNADQGYARALKFLPDLILLDEGMPDSRGADTVRLLKANSATCHIPIIFISNASSLDDRLAGLKAGAVDYIIKPLYVEEVLERIRIHLTLAQTTTPQTQEADLAHAGNPAAPSSHSPANLTLKQVATEFILSHIQDPALKSSDVATSLGLSLRRLNMVFESCDGMSAFEFIRQERMRRAALMLAQSTLSIADVALEVGYLNAANFSTEFKKFWQKPPNKFRSHCQLGFETVLSLLLAKGLVP